MTPIAILVLTVTVFSLGAVALGAFAVWQTRALASSMESRLEAIRAESDERTQILDGRIDAIAAQIGELERHPAVTLSPGLPKPGMNVMRRSQALRMNRRGDRPDQIATALELPRQEVDLLLKVHSIVIGTV